METKNLNMMHFNPANSVAYQSALEFAIKEYDTDPERAIHILEHLHNINEGHGRCFSELVLAKLRLKGALARTVYISGNCLGTWGRFGNQVNQFFTLHLLADITRGIIRHPYWMGNYLFGIKYSSEPTSYRLAAPNEIESYISGHQFCSEDFDIGTWQTTNIDRLISHRDKLLQLCSAGMQQELLNELALKGFVPDATVAVHARGRDAQLHGFATDFAKLKNAIEILSLKYPAFKFEFLTDDRERFSEVIKNLPQAQLRRGELEYYEEMGFYYDWLILRMSAVCLYNLKSSFSISAMIVSRSDQVRYNI